MYKTRKTAFRLGKGLTALAVSMLIVTETASALPRFSSALTIRGDRGGEVISYAIRMKELEEAGRDVRFSGSCDSACTLYLALPRSQTCITQGASFGFHLPYGASPRGNKVAAQYMMRQYPGWVKSWIRNNGGLTSGIKRMNYAYASRYIPTCGGAAKTTVASLAGKTKETKKASFAYRFAASPGASFKATPWQRRVSFR